MDIENFTPFTPALFVTAKDGVGYLATILVKATFRMRHGAVVQPLEKQLYPLGDVVAEGADPATASLVYASDFASRKVCADVLLAATAYRSAEQPTGTFHVGLHVGSLVKRLAVSGRRTVQRGVFSESVSESEPLAAIPIRYEHAWGGPQHATNPAGLDGKTGELPHIEYPGRGPGSAGAKPAPAGFGPISPEWEPRKSQFGTIGADYLEKYWPGFPGDFDQRYFNSAPADQQIDGYLRGDEVIELEHLHPIEPVFRTQLPGSRVACLGERDDGASELIPLALDTLWMNPDEELLVLSWRGRVRVQTPDALEYRRLSFLVEPLTAPPREVAQYESQVRQLMVERDGEFEPEPAPAAAASVAPAPPIDQPSPDEEAADAAAEAELQALLAQVAARAQTNARPGEQPPLPPLSPAAQARLEQALNELEAEERRESEVIAARTWTRDKVLAAAAAQQSLAGADLANLDLSACRLEQVDFRGAKLDGANLSRAQLTGAAFAGCGLEGAKFDSATLTGATFDSANCQQASLASAVLTGASLTATDLSGANLAGANLAEVAAERAIFQGASLAGAVLTRANLATAVLSGVAAARADLSGAQMNAAVADQADFSAANFAQADVTEARFSASRLAGAKFDGATAVDADFTGADLTGATFRGANCEGLWLSAAQATGVSFAGANCFDLQVDDTTAPGADFAGCTIGSFRGARADLTGAKFRDARGVEPIFEGCRVDGADFAQADLPGANFVRASAVGTNFAACDLRTARFDYANCQRASFAAANLFEANFAGVNLSEADISQANCFRVEFLDARISRLQFQNCNLKQTKLETWAATKAK